MAVAAVGTGHDGRVLVVDDVGFDAAAALLSRHGLELAPVDAGAPIPGSYWGEPEAGLVAGRVFARGDTPLHSLLHEACHVLVADPARRAAIHTDASDSQAEEDAACYLQILLADQLEGVGATRLMADMDAWGYTFRLGSAHAWFARDAGDAAAWLATRGLLPPPAGAGGVRPDTCANANNRRPLGPAATESHEDR
jgi:hypothetical protein